MIELPPIPDKEFFSIGEVSRITQLPSYVLRFWESEFRELRPARRNSGQRKYIRRDIEFVFTIKDLLHTRKFTIAGAKKHLITERKKKDTTAPSYQMNVDLPFQGGREKVPSSASPEALNVLKETKKELEDILKLLQ